MTPPALLPSPFGPDHPFAVATSQCLLCRAPSAVLAAFLPADSQAYGAPVGKDRTVLYGLCSSCFDLPDALDLVEAVILDATRGAAA
ncbi:MAG: hypothetical protein EDX89_14375 [Acidobacteria bacterium]|nr:MAG: hypothetical protein EDX89_14375 [Acidobacteriota bacterium]